MKFKFWVSFFLLCCFLKTHGQQVDSDSLINEIKLKVTNYFIEQGILDKSTVKGNLNYIFVNEIYEKKVIGYNTIGIYNIGVSISHSPQHILIKEKSTYKILNIKEIDILLKDVIDYSKRNKIEKHLLISYIKNIIGIYELAISEGSGPLIFK